MCYSGCDHESYPHGMNEECVCMIPVGFECPLNTGECSMKTNFYCPECESGGQRENLTKEQYGTLCGIMYACQRCNRVYTGQDLHHYYTAELADLMSDADYVRKMRDELSVKL